MSEADRAYDIMTFFEFVFILYLIRELLGIMDDLYEALQHKSQDIMNAMHLVFLTKKLLKKFKDGRWESLLENVKSFCCKHDIEIPDI